MILYIHGFASTGHSNKGNILKKYFGEDNVLCPTQPTRPDEAIACLESFILTCKEPLLLVGSSLGGYYGAYLARKHALPCVLINPSIYPYKTLSPYVGKVKRFGSDEYFEWNTQDLSALERYKITHESQELFFLMQQKGDEVLDYNEALTAFYDAQILLLEGGSHQFDGFEAYCYLIKDFYNSKCNC